MTQPQPPIDLKKYENWVQLCGSCDAGLPMACACPDGDPRIVILALMQEIERLRKEKAGDRS